MLQISYHQRFLRTFTDRFGGFDSLSHHLEHLATEIIPAYGTWRRNTRNKVTNHCSRILRLFLSVRGKRSFIRWINSSVTRWRDFVLLVFTDNRSEMFVYPISSHSVLVDNSLELRFVVSPSLRAAFWVARESQQCRIATRHLVTMQGSILSGFSFVSMLST